MAARAAYLAVHASTSALNRPHGHLANRPSRAARRHRTLARCDSNVNNVSEQSSATPRSRSIVVMCHHVTPHARAGLFSPANLLQGRVDVWCRCITAGLYLSDAIRTNSTVHLVLQSDDLASCRLVSVDGATVEGLAPAERTVALLLQRAMQHASLDELPTLAREAPGRRRKKEKASSVDDDDDDANNEGKSTRNAERRRRGWLAGQPGSRGPVPGIAVSDHHSLERALAWAMRGCGAVTLLDMDGDDAETVLGRDLDDPNEGDGTAVVVGDDGGLTQAERQTLMFNHGAILLTLGRRMLLASHCVVLAHSALDERDDGVVG